MIIEIDQSGKLEDTNMYTVIGAANEDYSRSISISPKEKRKLQSFFRRAGKPRMYIYHVFTALIVILLRKSIKRIDRIIIDTEYPGKEKLISNLLLQKFKRIYADIDSSHLVFQEIGKKSPAHILVYNTYKRRQEPSLTITCKEVISVLLK